MSTVDRIVLRRVSDYSRIGLGCYWVGERWLDVPSSFPPVLLDLPPSSGRASKRTKILRKKLTIQSVVKQEHIRKAYCKYFALLTRKRRAGISGESSFILPVELWSDLFEPVR